MGRLGESPGDGAFRGNETVSGADGREPDLRWQLVGREQELAAFGAAWEGRDGRGIVVRGPAGVGKSCLADECLERAARLGATTARATATAAASTIPLGAIAHLVPPGVDMSDPVKGFGGLAAAMAEAHRGRRWAVLVDDLHLLDTASAVLLRQLMDDGVLWLIGTLRTGEPVGEAVEALCGAAAPGRLDLTALDRTQVGAVLETVLGGRVGRRTVHELHTASGGNPLYLRELTTGAVAAGALAHDGELWELARNAQGGTPKLAELIGARLSAADSAGRPVLELLALCEPLPLADARAVAPPDALSALERSGLVRRTTDGRRTILHLLHPLYGDVLRDGLPELRRRTLLLEQAARVEAHGGRRRADTVRLATWRLAATGAADPRLLRRAAALARHVRDYERVVALLRTLQDTDHTSHSLLLLGEALFELGHQQQAEEVLIRAGELAGTDPERLEVTFIRTLNLFWAASLTAEALAVNEAALARMTGPEEQRMLRINEGSLRTCGGRPAWSADLLAELDPDPRQSPNISVWLMGAMMRSVALAVTGRTREAVAFSGKAYVLHRRLDDKSLMFAPVGQLVSRVLALMEGGRLEEARTAGHRAWDMHGEERNPVAWIWLAYHQARTEWLAGHVGVARRWFGEAAAVSREYRNHRGMRLALSGLGACAALTGDLAVARAVAREILDYPPMEFRAGEQRLGEAWLHARCGRLAKARHVLTEAARESGDTGDVASEGLLLTDVARLGGAHQVAGRLAELAAVCDGAFAPARAHLAAALVADDPAALLASAAELGAVGADLAAAEAASAAAAGWQRAGQPHEAGSAAARARLWAARCEGARTPLLALAQTAPALTEREREIVLLAAAGTASKDIAGTLRLSVRTVDNRLQRVYDRLGITGRHQLAEVLGLQGDAAPIT